MKSFRRFVRIGPLFVLFLLVGSQVGTAYANYGSASEGTLRDMGIYFVCGSDPSASDTSSCCNTGSSPTTPATTSGGTVSFTYNDTSRNRKVDVSVYAPTDSAQHPLIVFAGGYQTTPETYSRYIDTLVSKGYVIAALTFQNQNNPNYNGVVVPDFPNEADDVKFAIGKLKAEPQLQSRISTSAPVGMIGHSDGGYVALLAGYTTAHNAGLGAVLAADGNTVAGQPYTNGAPLLWIHGSLDQFESTASSTAHFNAIPASYKAFAEVIGADHNHYIVDANAQFNPPVDAMTLAFFQRNLASDSTASSSLSGVVKSTYNSVVTLTEDGVDNPGGQADNSISGGSSGAAPACCGAGSGGSTTLTGSTNEEKAYNFLIGQSYADGKKVTAIQAAAILGNMSTEDSTFDPQKLQDPLTTSPTPPLSDTVGWGIVQWTGIGTQQALIDAAKAQGLAVGDLGFQLKYLWTELTTGSEKAAGADLEMQTDIKAATDSFENKFERPTNYNDRTIGPTGSIALLAKYGSNGGSGGGSGSVTSSNGASCGGGGSGTLVTGDVKDLAQKILDNKNVTYDNGRSGEVASQLQGLTQGIDPGKCGKPVSPILLGYILGLAQNHKLQISSMVRPGDACGTPHASACAVDIDYFDSQVLNGTNAPSLDLIHDALAIFPTSQKLGFGTGTGLTVDQIGATGRPVTTFPDHPDHVHTDLRCFP